MGKLKKPVLEMFAILFTFNFRKLDFFRNLCRFYVSSNFVWENGKYLFQ